MKARSILVVLLLSLALRPAPAAAKAPEEDVEIVASGEMSSWGFSPSSITVPAGTTVTWHNTSSQAHSVTSRDHLFDSRLLDEDDEWSYTFTTPGTYRYFSVPFPFMKGTVVVTANEDGPSPPRATATPTPTSGSGAGGSGASGSGGILTPNSGGGQLIIP